MRPDAAPPWAASVLPPCFHVRTRRYHLWLPMERTPARHTMEAPPKGRCALETRGDQHGPAARWVGRIDELPDGRTLRRAVGVCERCAEECAADLAPQPLERA